MRGNVDRAAASSEPFAHCRPVTISVLPRASLRTTSSSIRTVLRRFSEGVDSDAANTCSSGLVSSDNSVILAWR
jgi:hypothetical protein